MRLIDANALLKELKKSCEYHAENSRELSLLQRDIIIVQEQPTVDAVPVRHGKWINKWSGDGSTWLEQRCSECGMVMEEEPIDYNFCPDCGARMDEE